MDNHNIFSLLDLPPELVELIIGYLDSKGLVQFGRCTTNLNELCQHDYFWQRRIHKEKPSVITISQKITSKFHNTLFNINILNWTF